MSENPSDLKKKKRAKFRFVDLFAGIGGMRLGFESAGGKCVYSSEWDDFCKKTYEANFRETPKGDITKIDASDIPDHDILVGGFPCQPFSIAGISKKKSLGRKTGFEDETQGTLFFDVCRIIEKKEPKAFVLENVKNLRSHDHGQTWKIIYDSLHGLGYEVFDQIIDGQAYVPQHRERIFIIGFKKDLGITHFNVKVHSVEPKPILENILETNVDPKYTISEHLWEYLQDRKIKQRAKGNGFGYSLAYPDGITHTLSARYHKDGADILLPQEGKCPRRLTPRECARLQGFPDSFVIPVSDGRAYRQFGNSVVVPLVSDIAKQVSDTLRKAKRNKK